MVLTPLRLPLPLLKYASIFVDIVVILSFAVFSYWLDLGCCYGLLVAESFGSSVSIVYYWVVLVATVVFVLVSRSVHQSWRQTAPSVMLANAAVAWLTAVLAVLVGLFLFDSSANFSRRWFVYWTLSVLFGVLLFRGLIYFFLHMLRRLGYIYKTVLLVGSGSVCAGVCEILYSATWSGLKVQGVLSPDQLERCLAQPGFRPPDEVWICLSLVDQVGVNLTLNALRHSTANIRLVPDWYALKMINRGVSNVMGISMLDLSTSPITGLVRLLKAAEDRVGAVFILMVVSLPMLAIAIAIKMTSRGPVLYKQLRHGWNGRPILVYKFRSMFVQQDEGPNVKQATKNDNRVTPFGSFLRRTSLDELPQFFNVLLGSMSIVGPRPHPISLNEYYKELVPGYMLRHKVKPGVTGWAQINGFRGETDTLYKMQQRVEHDLFYIENFSIWFDLKIIFMTLFKGWAHKNAY